MGATARAMEAVELSSRGLGVPGNVNVTHDLYMRYERKE